VFISGEYFRVNINDNHIGILWTSNMREKYRWYYRPRDDEDDSLLEDLKMLMAACAGETARRAGCRFLRGAEP
jgi:hypothetical protein